MLKINTARPLDPIALTILQAVKQATQQSGIATAVVGATARDILLTHVFDLPVQRATMDIDFAIALEDWHQFEQLKHTLTSSGDFYADPNIQSRLYYSPGSRNTRAGYPIDLLPFGGIEQSDHHIAWPPDLAVMMNVTGYAEVLAASIAVEVAPGQTIHVASLAGLLVLKLFAWIDRGRTNAKDAKDIYQIMRNYARAGNTDRLYNEEIELLEAAEYDPDLAGIRLLGRDVLKLARSETVIKILGILEDPILAQRLESNMLSNNPDQAEELQKVKQALEQFCIGLKLD